MVMSSPNALEMIQGVGKEVSRLKLDTEYGLQSSDPSNPAVEQIETTKHGITKLSIKIKSLHRTMLLKTLALLTGFGKPYSGFKIPGTSSTRGSDIMTMTIAADASVFSFGDEEDYERE
ncbi:hypothetical protein V6N13_043961 [Hibiscus sabdariffa]|uniref:Uncharacterized protein n=1 Tax=Hibiscus sabdariffa TaxID=183260 RepID=A0ABR2RGS0_9ROSI